MRRRSAPQIDPRAAIKARIDAIPAKAAAGESALVSQNVDFRRPTFGMLIEAAKLRRLSVQSYMRRAAYAFAAYDLGLPLSDALDRDPRVTRDTGHRLEDPTGTLFGPWEIEKLAGDD